MASPSHDHDHETRPAAREDRVARDQAYHAETEALYQFYHKATADLQWYAATLEIERSANIYLTNVVRSLQQQLTDTQAFMSRSILAAHVDSAGTGHGGHYQRLLADYRE